jgi:hypothetical protein
MATGHDENVRNGDGQAKLLKRFASTDVTEPSLKHVPMLRQTDTDGAFSRDGACILEGFHRH